MNTIIFLIILPLVISIILGMLPTNPLWIRKTIGFIVNILLIAAVVHLYFDSPDTALYFTADIPHANMFMLGVELILGTIIAVMAFRARHYYVIGLVVLQSAVMIVFEIMYGRDLGAPLVGNLFIDKFSLIMALIIGIIGSLICNYAIGYFGEYHEHHPEVKYRRRMFFFVFYLFISAMFGIVFSNNLIWLHFFWEITTFCSFILIGYRGDKDSMRSAFRAVWMNLLGGLAFAIAIFISYRETGIYEMNRLIDSGGAAVILPAALICFAGLIKSAQMPFSRWLTGAMVAPTPVSALLHSSTMVKAGVYIIIRFSPVLSDTPAGLMISLIGAVTFLITSFMAISQSNAKRVLAYSTISVLGLIVMCAGINTHVTIWAAILLIVFHAVAKSLLFLCVGLIEYKLHSRDIEDMDYLFMKMPKVAIMLNIGLGGMFLAPFGMLISKWVTLKALIDYNPIFGIILAFGSSATLFFYTKWMGKVITIENGIEEHEEKISMWEWSTLFIISLMTIAVCLVFPFISAQIIEPFILWQYGVKPVLDTFSISIIVTIMVGLLVLVPAGLLYYSRFYRGYKKVGVYLAGANMGHYHFKDAHGKRVHADLKNYYLSEMFDERKLLFTGIFGTSILVAIMFGVSIL